jgi:hypothetical protein
VKVAALMSEADVERQVRHIAKELGLLSWHAHDSRRSAAGLPDWIFVGKWLMFRELKRQDGKLTRDQVTWLEALKAAGQDVDTWRPSDLLSGRIATELAALAGIGGTA